MSVKPVVDDGSREEPPAQYREVRFRHSRDFVPILESLGATLLVSTYQAGKLVTVGATGGQLRLALHNFEQAMGIGVHPQRLAVGSRGVIWFLQSAAELAPRLAPTGQFDACYLARSSFISGNIHGHEMGWIGDELWVVNTLFSCLCTLHQDFSFVPRWRPPFISELAANDRCHLNGLAISDGRPRYVTVMAESDQPAGWRPLKAHDGRVLDIESGQPVTQGLAMPHSPRVFGGRLWVLNSGCGTLETVDLASGQRTVVTAVPGYTRGLAFHGSYAFMGMSRIRETAVFGGVPIAERRNELKCGVAVVDMRNGQSVAYIEFESGVEEVFDVQVLAARSVALTGPYPAQDDAQEVWVVPRPDQVAQLTASPVVMPVTGSQAAPQRSQQELQAMLQSALAMQQQGQFEAAVETLRHLVALRPNLAELHNHLGNALQNINRQDLALDCYRKAVSLKDTFAPAHQNIGYLLINMGVLDEGLEHLRRAQQAEPNDVNRVMLATSLPVVYASSDEVRERRAQLEANVQQLVDDRVKLDTENATVPTNFFAAYQGANDRQLQENLARVYRTPTGVTKGPRANRSGRIRVGFLSAHFRDHTIGRLNLGRVKLFDREQFEVTVLSAGHHQDATAEQFRQAADRFVALSGSVAEARRQVVEQKLDVLLFADVGMNAMTYTLAFSRMAGVQCVTWGHPVTTGSPSMDYFMSSELLETDRAEAHYSERLVRLENLGTYYYRPKLSGPARTRESFSLDPARHVYLCPQTLFKLLPEFDEILAEILRRDPLGDVYLLEARQTWMQLLKERFARTLGNVAGRVHFLPAQPNPDFLQLNALADVSLDPLHFGGGNTSYEALALGTPIVTLPGAFLRSRITQALYRKMNLLDFVVANPQEYVELALRLGTDKDYRRHASERIQASADVLFEDPEEVREVERFLRQAADAAV